MPLLLSSAHQGGSARQSCWRLEMPGNVGLHDRWARGKFWEKELADHEGETLEDYEEWERRLAERREADEAKVVLDFRVAIPPDSSPHDVILRVVEAERGDYRRLEYALREEGSIEAVREGEWKEVHEAVLEGWAIRFMVNVARISAGREDLLLAEGGEPKVEEGAGESNSTA